MTLDCIHMILILPILKMVSSVYLIYILQKLLEIIIPSCQLKQTRIGQAIVQAARPRSVITPILFGLSVEMDHLFGSKWLVNELSHLGFSISYDEVTRSKQYVIQSENLDDILFKILARNLYTVGGR